MSSSSGKIGIRSLTPASSEDVRARLRRIVGDEHIIVDPEKVEPYGQDAVKENSHPRLFCFLDDP